MTSAPKTSSERSDDLLFLGGEQLSKGLYDVLGLWSALDALDFRGSLHWYGNIGEDFRRLISRSAHADRIHLHGRQPRSQIFRQANASKVILVLSRGEPFGMVTIEAMGMGCVPIAWDVATGTKEVVPPGAGMFAPLGDYAGCARLVLAACKDHASLSASLTAHARSKFSESAMRKITEAGGQAKVIE